MAIVRLVLCQLVLGGLLLGCAKEAEVKLRFEPFSCGGVPAGSSLLVTVNEMVGAQTVTLRRLEAHSRCLAQPVPILATEVARILREKGDFLEGVPADRRTQLIMLISLQTNCSNPFPVCLLADPILPGGDPQAVFVRGLCGAAPGTAPSQQWAPCEAAINAKP